MNANRILLLLTLPILTAMRDPFIPVADPCQGTQLAQWHFRGVVQQGERRIGLMQSDEASWQRVEAGAVLNTGWRVMTITPDALTVGIGNDCEPQQWLWKREGTPNDDKDNVADVVEPAAIQRGEKRHADGGRRAGGASAAKPRRP